MHLSGKHGHVYHLHSTWCHLIWYTYYKTPLNHKYHKVFCVPVHAYISAPGFIINSACMYIHFHAFFLLSRSDMCLSSLIKPTDLLTNFKQVHGWILMKTTVGPCLLYIQWLYQLLVPARLKHVKMITMGRSIIIIMFSTFNSIIGFKKF